MNRIRLGVLLAGCLLLPVKVTAGEPDDRTYFGLRYGETRDNRVRVSSVDPKALAWQMGLRENDVFSTIAGRNGDKPFTKQIRFNKDVNEALRLIGKKEGASFTIVVDRIEPDSAVTQRVVLKGVIRESPKRPGFYYSANLD